GGRRRRPSGAAILASVSVRRRIRVVTRFPQKKRAHGLLPVGSLVEPSKNRSARRRLPEPFVRRVGIICEGPVGGPCSPSDRLRDTQIYPMTTVCQFRKFAGQRQMQAAANVFIRQAE